MRLQNIRLLILFGTCCASLALAGCSQYEPSRINAHRAEVTHDKFAQTVPAAQADEAFISGVAEQYQRFGNGPMKVTVSYDPRSGVNTAMKAGEEASRIVEAFDRWAVRGVETEIMPVAGSGAEGEVLITYDSVTAHPPRGCGSMPGLESDQAGYRSTDTYSLGCSVETMVSRQIARPKDLLGKGGLPGRSDGRRYGNSVEPYRSGVPNEPLDGEQASDE